MKRLRDDVYALRFAAMSAFVCVLVRSGEVVRAARVQVGVDAIVRAARARLVAGYAGARRAFVICVERAAIVR